MPISIKRAAARGKAEAAPFEGAAIAHVAYAYDEQVFASDVEESLGDGKVAFRAGALLAVAVVAVVLALLPAVVGVAIVLGWTVPLEFGAGAGLAVLAGFKAAAGTWGMVAASGTPRPAVPTSFVHL
jgi:hypothetical protein